MLIVNVDQRGPSLGGIIRLNLKILQTLYLLADVLLEAILLRWSAGSPRGSGIVVALDWGCLLGVNSCRSWRWLLQLGFVNIRGLRRPSCGPSCAVLSSGALFDRTVKRAPSSTLIKALRCARGRLLPSHSLCSVVGVLVRLRGCSALRSSRRGSSIRYWPFLCSLGAHPRFIWACMTYNACICIMRCCMLWTSVPILLRTQSFRCD